MNAFPMHARLLGDPFRRLSYIPAFRLSPYRKTRPPPTRRRVNRRPTPFRLMNKCLMLLKFLIAPSHVYRPSPRACGEHQAPTEVLLEVVPAHREASSNGLDRVPGQADHATDHELARSSRVFADRDLSELGELVLPNQQLIAGEQRRGHAVVGDDHVVEVKIVENPTRDRSESPKPYDEFEKRSHLAHPNLPG